MDMTPVDENIKRYPIEHLSIQSFPESAEYPIYKNEKEQVSVRCLTKDEKKIIEEKGCLGRDLPSHLITVKSSKTDSIILASRVITSFRLYSEGRIGYSKEFVQDKLLDLDVYGLPSRTPKYVEVESYAIDKGKLVSVQEIYQQIKGCMDRTDTEYKDLIQRALSRFNRSYDEENAEDALLDLIICFEILFTTKDTKNNGFEVAKLSAFCLMDKEKIKWDKVYAFLQKAYELRNGIVHEGDRFIQDHRKTVKIGEFRDIDPVKFLMEVKDYARLCLREFIKRKACTQLSSEQVKEEFRCILPLKNGHSNLDIQ